MQRVDTCRGSISLALSLVFFTSLVVGSPYKAYAVVGTRMITPSGQSIASIFDGLSPSAFALEYRFKSKSKRQRNVGHFLEESLLDRHFGAHLIRVDSCADCSPDTACADHYQKLVPSSGCTSVGCALPLNNAVTDSTNAPYDDGAYDTYCGADCCVDDYICPNP